MAQDTGWSSSEGAIDIECILDEAMAEAFVLVKIATDGDVGIADNATDEGIGVLQVAGASGDRRDIRLQGVSFVRQSAAINAGVAITATTNGKGVAASDGNHVYGKTLASGTYVDEVVPCLILPGTYNIEDIAG